MSPPWTSPLDVDRLADGQADIDFTVPLADLPRLRSKVAGVSGLVRGRVHFTRERGFVVADLELQGSAEVACQRCMRPMNEPIDSRVRVALIAAEADAERVPEDLEPVLASGGHIRIDELVEEELLLALPIVSMHPQSSDCAVAAQALAAEPQQSTQKPFAQLGKLLKRSSNS